MRGNFKNLLIYEKLDADYEREIRKATYFSLIFWRIIFCPIFIA